MNTKNSKTVQHVLRNARARRDTVPPPPGYDAAARLLSARTSPAPSRDTVLALRALSEPSDDTREAIQAIRDAIAELVMEGK